jgi:predicted ATPase
VRITKLKLENLLSFDDVELELGDLTILVGPNGVGKTNVLRALRLLGDLAESLAAPDPRYFKDPSKLLKLSAEVKAVDDVELVKDFLRLHVARDILKMLHTEESALQELIESLVAPGGPLDEIMPEPSGVELKCEPPTPSGAKLRSIFKLRLRALKRELCLDITSHSKELSLDCERPCALGTGGPTQIANLAIQRLADSKIIKDKGPATIQEPGWPPKREVEVLREKLGSPMRLGLADALLEELNRTACILIGYEDLTLSFISDVAKWPGGLGEASRRLLEGLRRIGHPTELDYIVSLQSLLRRILARSIIALEQLRGPIPKAIDIGDLNASGPPRSLDTREAVLALARLEHISSNASDRGVLAEIRNEMQKTVSLSPYTYLEPEPTGNSFRVKVKFEENGRELPPDLVPAGAIELLSVLTAIVAARGGVLLLDEPGQNLHPTKQVELLRAIGRLALEQGTQVVIVTHSPYMLDPDLIVGIRSKVRVYRISKACGSSRIHAPFEGRSGEERVEILTRLQKNPNFRAALFSSAAVVVEGYGELVFLEALRSRGLLPDYEPLAIVYGEGKGSVKNYLRWLEGFGVPALAFCDNDCLGKLPDDLKQRAIVVNKYDLGDYIGEKFGDECEESCKDPEKIHELMMEADKEYLEKIVKELKLKECLSKILSSQTRCSKGCIDDPPLQ